MAAAARAPTRRSTARRRPRRRACAPRRSGWRSARSGRRSCSATARWWRAIPAPATATTRSSPPARSTGRWRSASSAPRYREDALAGLPHAGRRVPVEQPRRRRALGRRRGGAPDGRAPQAHRRRPRLPRDLPRGQPRVAREDAAARARAREPAAQVAAAGTRARLRPALLERRRLDPRRGRPRAQGAHPVRPRLRAGPAVGGPRRHPAPPQPGRARVSRSATACSSRCASARTATTWCAWCSTSRTSASTRCSSSRIRRAS